MLSLSLHCLGAASGVEPSVGISLLQLELERLSTAHWERAWSRAGEFRMYWRPGYLKTVETKYREKIEKDMIITSTDWAAAA
jgi:hypothetical protein